MRMDVPELLLGHLPSIPILFPTLPAPIPFVQAAALFSMLAQVIQIINGRAVWAVPRTYLQPYRVPTLLLLQMPMVVQQLLLLFL